MAHMTTAYGMVIKPVTDRLHRLWCDAVAWENPKPEEFRSPNDRLDLNAFYVSSEIVY